jgi:protein SCO1
MKITIVLAALCGTLFAVEPAQKPSEEKCPACEEAAKNGPHGLPAAVAAEGTIFDLTSSWKNETAKAIKLADLRGKPTIITMGYTSCQFACPRLMADLMAVERNLTEDEKKAVQFVFVSIDPVRDTPEKLKAFIDQYHLNVERWHGFQGDLDSVQELSVVLGIRYRKLESGDFAHSNRLLLLDQHGVVTKHIDGLGENSEPLIEALRKLLVK